MEKVKFAAMAGVKALEVNNCACHAEIKVQEGKAYIMEIGARLGGDFISTELTHLSTGIDMVAAAINCALGIAPCLIPQKDKCGVCIRYFCPPPGVLESISNLNLLDNPNVYSFGIYCNPGDVIPEIKSSLDRIGHVITISENVQQSIAKADELLSDIVFNVN